MDGCRLFCLFAKNWSHGILGLLQHNRGNSGHRISSAPGLFMTAEQTFSALFDHLVGGHKQGLWHNEAEYLRGLEIDHQFELGWLLDRQVRRAGSV